MSSLGSTSDSIFKKLFNRITNNQDKMEDKNSLTCNITSSGLYSRVSDIIYNIIKSAQNNMESEDMTSEFDLSSYLNLISLSDIAQYGVNITDILNSTDNFKFEFIDHVDSFDHIQKFCIITEMHSNEILCIFKVTEDKEQYSMLDIFLSAYHSMLDHIEYGTNNKLYHFVYRHLCGTILNYAKLSITRFSLPEEGMVYMIMQWPDKCELLNYNKWVNLSITK